MADHGITLMADQTVRKNRAKTRIDGTFEYIDKAQGISVKCEFDKTLSPVNSALVKCEGNRPCVLVLQAQATGKVDPNKGNSANDDPFG